MVEEWAFVPAADILLVVGEVGFRRQYLACLRVYRGRLEHRFKYSLYNPHNFIEIEFYRAPQTCPGLGQLLRVGVRDITPRTENQMQMNMNKWDGNCAYVGLYDYNATWRFRGTK